ncbi:MAG: nucleotidyltransferase domain-containing protein [Ignavibacteria bacterium]|nr:nucleotidyltransferase domain-containing protein [Ignavibacteria bacterium]
MLNKATAIEQVKNFLNDLKNIGLELNKAILFGSSARDEMNEWSDIDLMLVSDKFTLNVFENIRLYSKINVKYPDIDTHPYPTDYFMSSDPFIEEIKRTGIEIHF